MHRFFTPFLSTGTSLTAFSQVALPSLFRFIQKKKKINRSNNISRFAKTHTLPFFSACVSGVLKRAMDEFETVWHKLAIIIIT
jgi:hypothetical protein